MTGNNISMHSRLAQAAQSKQMTVADKEKIAQINQVIAKMSDVLTANDKLNEKGLPYTRDDYLLETMQKAGVYDPEIAKSKTGKALEEYEYTCMGAYHKKTGKDIFDLSFSLTPTEIIEQKIPRGVIGCTGTAKLFCHYAREIGLDCSVVATAVYDDLNEVKQRSNLPPENRAVINGHQIIGVQLSDGLHVFDPAYRGEKTDKANKGELRAKWFKGPSKLADVDYFLGENAKPCQIRAIVPSEEFDELKTYRQLSNLLVSGDMHTYRYKEIENENSLLFLKMKQKQQAIK